VGKVWVDRLKSDLQSNDPYRRVGSGPEQNLAWDWVRMKEAEEAALEQEPVEMVTIKPNVHGVGVDLTEVGRRIQQRFKKS
jgi:hypothetical protein